MRGWQLWRESVLGTLRLLRWRLRQRGQLPAEGISRSEFYLVLRREFVRQYRRERGGLRRYRRTMAGAGTGGAGRLEDPAAGITANV
jgi:hypothetical protein